MARKTQVKEANSFNLGDWVRVKEFAGLVGRIEELRGPLGPGGALVYRVGFQKKPRASYVELLGSQLELTDQVVTARPRATAPKASRAKRGG